MKKIIISSALIIILVWGGYYLNFGLAGSLSEKSEVWGQFGDYVGGVLNPILTFITIYLLINSLSLQREANNSLVNEIKRQEALENYKKFEMRFFHLIESQEKTFLKLKVRVGDAEEEVEKLVEEYTAGPAVTYIEDCLVVLMDAKTEKEKITQWLNDIDIDDCIFSITRRFYLIVKLICESPHNKDEYFEMLINLTDIKLISLVSISCIYYDWEIVQFIKNSGILDRDGIREFISKVTPIEDE